MITIAFGIVVGLGLGLDLVLVSGYAHVFVRCHWMEPVKNSHCVHCTHSWMHPCSMSTRPWARCPTVSCRCQLSLNAADCTSITLWLLTASVTKHCMFTFLCSLVANVAS